MIKVRLFILVAIISVFSGLATAAQGFTTELRSMGYSLIPTPREVSLKATSLLLVLIKDTAVSRKKPLQRKLKK